MTDTYLPSSLQLPGRKGTSAICEFQRQKIGERHTIENVRVSLGKLDFSFENEHYKGRNLLRKVIEGSELAPFYWWARQTFEDNPQTLTVTDEAEMNRWEGLVSAYRWREIKFGNIAIGLRMEVDPKEAQIEEFDPRRVDVIRLMIVTPDNKKRRVGGIFINKGGGVWSELILGMEVDPDEMPVDKTDAREIGDISKDPKAMLVRVVAAGLSNLIKVRDPREAGNKVGFYLGMLLYLLSLAKEKPGMERGQDEGIRRILRLLLHW